MGDLFRRHPEYFVPDQETGFRKVASGCCAYSDVIFWIFCTQTNESKNIDFLCCIVQFVSYFNYRIGKDFQETGKCRVHVGKPTKGYGFVGFLVRKDSSYRDKINQG